MQTSEHPRWSFIGVVLSLMMLSSPLVAERPTSNSDPDAAGAGQTFDDAAVLRRLHDINEFGMKLGEMARSKGQEEIRQLGRRLYNDHQLTSRRVTALAGRKSIALDGWIPESAEEKRAAEKHEKILARLGSLEGERFESAFFEAVVEGHAGTVAMLNQSMDNIYDAGIRAFMRRLIPILQQHVTLAQHVRQRSEHVSGR